MKIVEFNGSVAFSVCCVSQLIKFSMLMTAAVMASWGSVDVCITANARLKYLINVCVCFVAFLLLLFDRNMNDFG